LIIESPKKETYAFITFEGKDIINYKVVPILSNISYFEYKLLKAYRPEISCSINLAKDKILYNYSKKIEIYPDEGILNIKIKTNKKIYKPGEEVEILIDVTDANGNPVKTELSLGVVDSSVFYFRSGFNTDIKKFFSRHRRIQPWVLNFKENIMFNKRKNTMPVTSFFAVVETLPGVIRVGDQLHIRGGRGDQVNYMVDGISITDPVTGTFGGTLNENSIQSMNLMASGFSAEYGEAIQGLHLPVPVGDLVSEVNVIVPNLFIKPELRGYFPDTALWIPDLVTDREGFAKVTFKIPDTLTEWKISSIGITKDTKAGMEFIKIKTTKNILVRLETPRFLTQRDSLTISGIVHNYLTTAKLVKGKLISENIEMKTSEQKSTTIQPNKSFRFNWEVFAKESGEATFTLEGLTNEDSDAMRLKIPILPFGIKENTSINGKINDKTDQLEIIDIPETAQLDSLEVIINISNGSLPTEMFDSLEYLIGYPYGCIEQTMSRFLPTLITIRTLKRFGLENKKIELKVPDMVTKGIQRLEQMQHSDGGWGWWQHDKTHPYMTAYVVYGLNIAIKEGYKVPQNVYRNGVRSLKEQFHKSETNDTFVYMGYVISGLGHVDNFSREKILKLFHNRQKISAFGEPLLAIALMNINEVNKAKEIMDSISVKAIFDQKKRECYFSGRAFEYSWRKNDLEITANCLRAFAKIDPFDEKVQLVINWLINKKNNGNWGDTKNSANVIFAFAEYVGNKSALASEFKYSVFVNDKEMLNEKINNKDLEGSNRKLILDGKTIKHGKNQIHIVKKGKDKLFYNISIKYYNEATSIPEKSKNVSVKRNYKLVKENNDINNGTIASGVEFEVELEISSKDKLEYLMIEDYIPAGCEIVNRKSGRSKYHWIAHQEFRDEKAVFFITKFQGKKTIKYKLRAEIPGTYNVLPTIVTSMYFPEVYANSNSYKLKIIE
ncbi:TonB-dependent receptor plug domain-containing protein, partial [Candidatus Dependentiae bacterium]|nr:TonB-dependent receptor plug domain-containing protein [Candidatus Dependentiae bacterium]